MTIAASFQNLLTAFASEDKSLKEAIDALSQPKPDVEGALTLINAARRNFAAAVEVNAQALVEPKPEPAETVPVTS